MEMTIITVIKIENSVNFDFFFEKLKILIWDETCNSLHINVLFQIFYFCCFLRFLDPLLDDVEYNLATDTILPFNFKNPYLYPLAYLIVMVALWYAGFYVVITGATMQAHLVHLLCQFMVLVDCFENLLEDCSKAFPGN